MSQGDLGTLIPAETSGTELASRLRTWRNAIHTSHSGNARPSYAQPGLLWIDTSGNPWVRKLWTGTADVELDAINPSTGVVTSRQTLADSAVTFPKLQNITPGVIGRTAGGSGNAGILSFAALYAQIAGPSPVINVNGYVRIPVSIGGDILNIILQWGFVSGGNGDAQVVYPVTFPFSSLYVDAVMNAAIEGDRSLSCSVRNINASGFVVNRRFANNGGGVGAANQPFQWFALGY